MARNLNLIADKITREFEVKGGKVIALNNVNLKALEGEVLGVLGPNGAGKTTLIRILSTLLLPTSGSAKVMGFDVVKEPEKVREVINMASGAERSGYDFISARKNLWFFSQLYGIPGDEANKRIEELAEELSFKEYLDSKFYSLSTGYKQRVTIARAFINKPSVVFLDEPTIGLDVMTAMSIREFLKRKARDERITILLATHNMPEVEAICDRVAIIDKGRIIAEGTPEALKSTLAVCAYAIEIKPIPVNLRFLEGVEGIKGYTMKADSERGTATLQIVLQDEELLESVLSILLKNGVKVLNRWRKEPTLEEVFVSYVGRGFRERESES